jgi:hypothetical protein
MSATTLPMAITPARFPMMLMDWVRRDVKLAWGWVRVYGATSKMVLRRERRAMKRVCPRVGDAMEVWVKRVG